MAHRFSAPTIPPTTPTTRPATNPPPIMRLKIANGKMITSAIAPCRRAITIEPKIIVRPIMMPSANAYPCPIAGSHQKIVDQFTGGP